MTGLGRSWTEAALSMEPLLTKYVREPNSFTLDFYLQHEGYEGLKKALAHDARPGRSSWSRRRACAAAAAPASRPA